MCVCVGVRALVCAFFFLCVEEQKTRSPSPPIVTVTAVLDEKACQQILHMYMIKRALTLNTQQTKQCFRLWGEKPEATATFVFTKFGFTLGNFCVAQVLKRYFPR